MSKYFTFSYSRINNNNNNNNNNTKEQDRTYGEAEQPDILYVTQNQLGR